MAFGLISIRLWPYHVYPGTDIPLSPVRWVSQITYMSYPALVTISSLRLPDSLLACWYAHPLTFHCVRDITASGWPWHYPIRVCGLLGWASTPHLHAGLSRARRLTFACMFLISRGRYGSIWIPVYPWMSFNLRLLRMVCRTTSCDGKVMETSRGLRPLPSVPTRFTSVIAVVTWSFDKSCWHLRRISSAASLIVSSRPFNISESDHSVLSVSRASRRCWRLLTSLAWVQLPTPSAATAMPRSSRLRTRTCTSQMSLYTVVSSSSISARKPASFWSISVASCWDCCTKLAATSLRSFSWTSRSKLLCYPPWYPPSAILVRKPLRYPYCYSSHLFYPVS